MDFDSIFMKCEDNKDDTKEVNTNNNNYETEHQKLMDEIHLTAVEADRQTTKQLSKVSDESKKLINELNQAIEEDSATMEVVISGLLSILKNAQTENALLKRDKIILTFKCEKYEAFIEQQKQKIISLENNLKNNFFGNYK